MSTVGFLNVTAYHGKRPVAGAGDYAPHQAITTARMTVACFRRIDKTGSQNSQQVEGIRSLQGDRVATDGDGQRDAGKVIGGIFITDCQLIAYVGSSSTMQPRKHFMLDPETLCTLLCWGKDEYDPIMLIDGVIVRIPIAIKHFIRMYAP